MGQDWTNTACKVFQEVKGRKDQTDTEKAQPNEERAAAPLPHALCLGLWDVQGQVRILQDVNGYTVASKHILDAAVLLAVGSFLLTVELFCLQLTILVIFTYSWSFFAYSFSFLPYSWSFLAYSGKVLLIRALRDCKQRSLTCKQKSSNCK